MNSPSPFHTDKNLVRWYVKLEEYVAKLRDELEHHRGQPSTVTTSLATSLAVYENMMKALKAFYKEVIGTPLESHPFYIENATHTENVR